MRRWLAKWFGWLRAVAFLCLCLGLLVRISDPPALETLRNSAFDIYHRSKPRQMVPLPVAIIDIDDRSLEELGQWPWPRTRLAQMLDLAAADGAAAVGFDIVFAEPDRLSPGQIAQDNPGLPAPVAAGLMEMPDNDDALAQAFARMLVVAGQTSVRTDAGNRDDKQVMADIPHAVIGPDPAPFLMRFPDVVQNLPALEAAAAGHGMFATRPDPDGVYRRAPLVMQVQGKLRLGLAPELLRVATGRGPFILHVNEAGVEAVSIARQRIATDRDGTMWPYLTRSERARYVPAADLLQGRTAPGRLAGHLVLIGTSAIGLEDFRPTPLGVAMAGVEIHAQVLENMLTQSMLLRPNYAIAVELVTTLVLCTLVIIFVPVSGARAVIAGSLALMGLYVGLSYYLFHQYRLLIDPSFPVLATLIAIMLLSSVNYLREERQRRAIRSAFGQYVSPDLVDRLSRHPERLALGGETRELTLLFSDVRGFTAIAEQYKDDPEALTGLMNRFLTILSDAILEYGGTIDKFMGDAVMAFWNAPVRHDDHVRLACNAALRMMRDIRKFNARRAAQTRLDRMKGRKRRRRADRGQRINVGIGINTGSCVVGNMGSDTRFDYTALGDPVNVASRLEGQSRYYGVQVILGAATAAQAQDEFAILELDTVRVVGKDLPENIFALLGDGALGTDPRFRAASEANNALHRAYRDQQWDAAEAALDELTPLLDDLRLGLKEYVALYRSRITDLRADPPGADWDGVFAFTKKSA